MFGTILIALVILWAILFLVGVIANEIREAHRARAFDRDHADRKRVGR